MQAKLLRVLQYKEFMPLGAKQASRTDVRIIAATNVDLAEKVAAGSFREDLFYRLQVVTIQLPPLRDRTEDLPDLVRVLLGRVNDELRSNVTRISREAMECLSRYGWPGNVRELENVLMKTVALCPGNVLSVDMFPREFCRGIVAEAPSPRAPGLVSLERLERDHVARVLDATRWHRGQACEILGVSRPRLRRMIRQYGLELPPGVDGADDDPDEDS